MLDWLDDPDISSGEVFEELEANTLLGGKLADGEPD